MPKSDKPSFAAAALAAVLLTIPAARGDTISFASVKSTLVGSNLEDFTDSDAVYSLTAAGAKLIFGGDLDSGYLFNGEEYLFAENDNLDVEDGFAGIANFNSGAELSDLRFALAGNQLPGEYATIRNTAANKNAFFASGWLYGNSDDPWGVIMSGGLDASGINVIGAYGEFQQLKFTGMTVDASGAVYAAGTEIDGYTYLISLNASGSFLWDDFQYLGICGNDKTHLLLSPDGGHLYVGLGKKLRRFTTSGKTAGSEYSFDADIRALAFDRHGTLTVITADATIHWLSTGETISVSSHQSIFADAAKIDINAIGFAEDNRMVIAGGCSAAIFKSTDGTTFSGSRSGFVLIRAADSAEIVFASYIGTGYAEVFDAVFANDILTVAGATVETGWVQGGLCVSGEVKPDNRTWGFLKTWTGGAMVPDPDGVVKVNLTPNAGKWKINGSQWLDSGFATNLAPGSAYTIYFKPIESHKTPPSITGVAKSAVTNIYNLSYTYVPPPLAKRTIEGTRVSFSFNLPAAAAYAEIIETFPAGGNPTPVITDPTILTWQPRTRRLSFYSDLAQEYTLQCSANGIYRITGKITVYDADNNILLDSATIDGEEVFVYPTGLLITVQ